MYLVREARPEDLDPLHQVARHLNSVNLPDDRAVIARLLDRSTRSFGGALAPFQRQYLFVLVDTASGGIVGTSMIIAQHGTRGSPHVFFDVLDEERYSETLQIHVRHRVLRIGYNYDGPTEIGGLILLPELRKTPFHLGKLLSFSRFVFMGIHRPWFRDQILSELLPPLEPDGTSLLWEHLGRRFTGLPYTEADRLSQENKEFIRTLFPQDPLYTCMLPDAVQALIGVVGPRTRGVEAMLRGIGFAYAHRIDPFNGGPHFIARTDEITLLRALAPARLAPAAAGAPGEDDPWGLAAVERPGQGGFVTCGTRYRRQGDEVVLAAPACDALALRAGDSVWLQPV